MNILHGGTIASMVDLGGSLAVASRGLFATGVSTDLNVTYLSSGGKIGDLVKAEVSCDKCKSLLPDSNLGLWQARIADLMQLGRLWPLRPSSLRMLRMSSSPEEAILNSLHKHGKTQTTSLRNCRQGWKRKTKCHCQQRESSQRIRRNSQFRRYVYC